MITEWTKGLDADDAARFELTFKNSGVLRDRLHTVIENKIRDTERVQTNDYDSPAWAYKAADREGFIRALNYVLLLTKENPISGTK